MTNAREKGHWKSWFLHGGALAFVCVASAPAANGSRRVWHFLAHVCRSLFGNQVPAGAQWSHCGFHLLSPALSSPVPVPPSLTFAHPLTVLHDSLPAGGWTSSLFRHVPAPARSVRDIPWTLASSVSSCCIRPWFSWWPFLPGEPSAATSVYQRSSDDIEPLQGWHENFWFLSSQEASFSLGQCTPFLPNLSAEGGVLGGTTFVRSQRRASRSFLQGHLCIAKKGHTEPVCRAEDLLEADFGFTWTRKHNNHLKASFPSSRIYRRISQTLKCLGIAWRPC